MLFLGMGMMEDILKHLGTMDFTRDSLKMEVNTQQTASNSVWSCRFSLVSTVHNVVLCDAERTVLADDVTILRCQAVVSTRRLANLERGEELVQVIGECRVGFDCCDLGHFVGVH